MKSSLIPYSLEKTYRIQPFYNMDQIFCFIYRNDLKTIIVQAKTGLEGYHHHDDNAIDI